MRTYFYSHLPESLLQEVYPDGLLVALREDATTVPLDEAGLAHGAVAHDDHLDGQLQEVVADDAVVLVLAQVRDVHGAAEESRAP